MTRIYLHIGLEHVGAARLQQVMADKREQMLAKGVLFPRAAGPRNHTRLFMAVTDPDHVDALRAGRGYADPVRQAALRSELATTLARDIATHQPQAVILSASQLGTSLARRSELERLRDLLVPLSRDIRIVAHVDAPARMLARHYAAQVLDGRSASLDLERGLPGADWWDAALAKAPVIDAAAGHYFETHCPPFWLDHAALMAHWEGVFGAGTVRLRAYDAALFHGEAATEEIRAAFDIAGTLGRAIPVPVPEAPAAAWIARARQLNMLLERLQSVTGQIVPRALWGKFIQEVKIGGDPIDPGSLYSITQPLEARLKPLLDTQAALDPGWVAPGRRAKAAIWTEADPGQGFRASQYLLAFRGRIARAAKAARQEARDGSVTADDSAGVDLTPQVPLPAEIAPEATAKEHKTKKAPLSPAA
ncbi:MAG: hypothetical protein B7X55_11335, partial [Rhodobacterales bacterium 34-62-10]